MALRNNRPAVTPVNVDAARRRAYFEFSDADFREGVYSLAKSLQAQGISVPDNLQAYVDHVDKVKRDHPKPPRPLGRGRS